MIKGFKEYILEKAEYKPLNGESEIVHHVSPHDFARFYPLSHFGTKQAAGARAYDMTTYSTPSKYLPDRNKLHTPHHLYTARIKLGHVVDIDDHGGQHTPENITTELYLKNHISGDDATKFHEDLGKFHSNEEMYNYLGSELNKRGIHTLRYVNKLEHPGSTSYIITDPSQVRILKKRRAPLNLLKYEKHTTVGQ